MAWTTPRTWTSGETLTAANMNTHVRDNENWLANDFPRCKATRAAAQSIADSTGTAINLTAETFDVGGMHDNVTNNTLLTVPTGAGGHWLFGAQTNFDVSGTGRREIRITLNGTSTILVEHRTFSPSGSVGSSLNVTGVHALAAGDTLQVVVVQSSGGALNATGSDLWAIWLGF